MCETERLFSCPKRLKTFFLNTMGESRLVSLALMNSHHDFPVSPDELWNIFIWKHKTHMFQNSYPTIRIPHAWLHYWTRFRLFAMLVLCSYFWHHIRILTILPYQIKLENCLFNPSNIGPKCQVITFLTIFIFKIFKREDIQNTYIGCRTFSPHHTNTTLLALANLWSPIPVLASAKCFCSSSLNKQKTSSSASWKCLTVEYQPYLCNDFYTKCTQANIC